MALSEGLTGHPLIKRIMAAKVRNPFRRQSGFLVIDESGACMYPAQPPDRMAIPILSLRSPRLVARCDQILQRRAVTRIDQTHPQLI